jgi:hypothetical protein
VAEGKGLLNQGALQVDLDESAELNDLAPDFDH